MAGKPLQNDGRFSRNSSLGKEFVLPSISSPWLMNAHPDISFLVGLKEYHTAILDDSCIYDVMVNPSIALVESVEDFALGRIDNTFGHRSVEPDNNPFGHLSVDPDVCVAMSKLNMDDAECTGGFFAFPDNWIVQGDAIASASELKNSSYPQCVLSVEEKFRTMSTN